MKGTWAEVAAVRAWPGQAGITDRKSGEAAYEYFRRRSSWLEDWESGGDGWTTSGVNQKADPAGPPRDLSPPREPVYFSRGYPSSVKGGTAIAAGVMDRQQHAARLVDPEGYRPGPCRHCGGKLHAHDYATRSPVGEAPVEIRRYTCPRCGGVVRVLPEFLARGYWRVWEVIEATCAPQPQPQPQPQAAGKVAPRARRPTPSTPDLASSRAARYAGSSPSSFGPGARLLATAIHVESTRGPKLLSTRT